MLKIDELILRVPGHSEEEARSLGEEVARRVADGLPVQQRERYLGSVDLRVRIPHRTSKSQMAKLIAQAILKGII